MRSCSKRTPNGPSDCPLNECLQLLNGAWSIEIVYYLFQCPKRFGDLKRELSVVSAKVLTSRLRALESRGVIERRVLPSSPPAVEYRLTALGLKLEPVLRAIENLGRELKKSRRIRKS